MRTDSPIELYANVRGREPMQMLKLFPPDELPDNEHEAASAIETAIEVLNRFPREIDMQMVVMQDGLIIAVEGQTSRKLLWCN